MTSQLSGAVPPFVLPGDTMLFHDWRWIAPPAPGGLWQTGDGGRLPLFAAAAPDPPLTYTLAAQDAGAMRLVVQPGTKSEPFLTAANAPVSAFLQPGTVMFDGGRYRLWFQSWTDHELTRANGPDKQTLLLYAESDDGEQWRFPAVAPPELADLGGGSAVFGTPLVPRSGFEGASVFVDPSAPAAERYRMIHQGWLGDAELERYCAERPGALPADARRRSGHVDALFAASSPDGLRWVAQDRALLAQYADTHNVCSYDAERGTYVAYIRDRLMTKRAIGRAESADFLSLPRPETVLWPTPPLTHLDLWYASGKNELEVSAARGAGVYHLMFPMRWNLATDRFDFFLAASPDNVCWALVEPRPVASPGAPGSWDAECVRPGRGLVPLAGDRVGMVYAGQAIPHKYPRSAPLGGLAWLTWSRDRLVALCAESASFRTQPVVAGGQNIEVNAKIAAAGDIRIGVHRVDGSPVPGRTTAECVPLRGDSLDHRVVWRAHDNASRSPETGIPTGEPVVLTVALRHAELFAIRLR